MSTHTEIELHHTAITFGDGVECQCVKFADPSDDYYKVNYMMDTRPCVKANPKMLYTGGPVVLSDDPENSNMDLRITSKEHAEQIIEALAYAIDSGWFDEL